MDLFMSFSQRQKRTIVESSKGEQKNACQKNSKRKITVEKTRKENDWLT